MLITDHINLTGVTPLVGTSRCHAQDAAAGCPDQRAQFVDMTETYSKQWRAEFTRAAESTGRILHEGVYAGLPGPQYETPAEVRMLRQLGADAIGMSTVLEAIQARALGLEVAGFSCLTTWAAGIGSGGPSHEKVLETGKAVANIFSRLLDACLASAKQRPNEK
jgi:purine-nucleoside phosphorylase